MAQDIQVRSPDGNVLGSIDVARGSASYRVAFQGKEVISPSTIGISIDGQNLGMNAVASTAATRSFKENYPMNAGHKTAINSFNEAIIPLTSGTTKIPWQLEVRAYNDGFAYRYRVPLQGDHRIDSETSQWKLPANALLWYQTNTREYESAFREMQAARVTSGATIAAPITAKLPNGLGYAMITEANLVNYSDMAYTSGEPGVFNAVFDKDPKGWTNTGEIASPWRVTLIAPDLNGLVNSDLLTNLCPAPASELTNANWVRPGRSTWHWMVTGRPRLNLQNSWIDNTKKLGFEYYLIDDGWVDWRAENKDQWACMKDVVDYGKSQGVAIWAWVHSKEVHDDASRMAYFQKAKAAGIVGLKIDFMGPPGADWIKWYNDTLRDAASLQLMIDFHGAVKPTGRERTWPNELTRESIFGRESGKLPALHDTALPFTRYVQGPADFTPLDFRLGRLGGGSWAHELAQAIVYTSPFYCFGGDPEDYLANPAIDVVKALPATWDETVVLPASEIGRTAAFARRKGNEWFVGVINGNDARPFDIDLSFLSTGRYKVDKLADSSENNAAWDRKAATLTNKNKFTVQMRRNGGFVARITPLQ